MPYTPRGSIREYVAPPPTVTGIPLDVDWRVILPALADVTNLWTNPSWELNTTGATAVGGTIARTTAKQRRGAYSLQVSPTAGLNDGVFLDRFSVTAGLPYTHGFDFWGPGGVAYQAYVADVSGGKFTPVFTFTGKGYWERLYFRRPEILTTSRRLYITKNNTANIQPFYLDGVAVIQTLYPFSYFDGDSAGFVPGRQDFYWTGTPHGSTSVMIAQSRASGRIVSLSTYGFMLLAMLGLGMGPLNNVSIPLALVGGDQYQRTVKGSRTFDLVGTLSHSSRQRFENNLASLEAAFAPDALSDQPTVLQYQPLNACGKPDGETLEVACKLAGGLEGKRDNPYQENLDLKFAAYFPFVARLSGQEGASLSVQSSVANANYVLQRTPAGTWQAMGTGGSGGGALVSSIVIGPDGAVYLGGTFALMGGVAGTVGIAKWNGSVFTPLGSGLNAGGSINSMVIGPDGSLYVAGSFTSAGGVANTPNIAKWNGAVWSALGTGINGTVWSLSIGTDGSLYAGGSFTLAGGVANTINIAKWNGAAWSALGVGITGGGTAVRATVIGPDGSLYIAGQFTTANAVTVNGIAKWTGTTFVALGASTGISGGSLGYAQALLFTPDGSLYVGGGFSTVAGLAISNLARWNGTGWSAVGSSVSGGGNYINSNGLSLINQQIYISGQFTTAGGLLLPSPFVIWTGSAFAAQDIVLPGGSANIYQSAIDKNQNVYVGFATSGTATVAGLTTLTNSGSAAAYPIIKISHPASATANAVLYQIKNYTTGELLPFNLSLLPGETLTIDLTPGNKTITSNFRGSLLNALLPGHNFSTFHLQPGANALSVTVTVASGSLPTGWAYWSPAYNTIQSAIR